LPEILNNKSYLFKLQTISYQFCKAIGPDINIYKGYLYLYQNGKLKEYIENNKDHKNLDFSVKEQPTGSISAGAGYGSSGALIQTSINEKNFLGKGINLNASITASQERINGELSYLEPNFNNSNRDLIAGLYSERNQYDNGGYTNKKIGAKLGTRYDVYEDIYFKPSVSLQYDSLATTSDVSSLLRSRQGDYFTTLLGYSFFVDKKNSRTHLCV
jgi:outer membrane protein insertion porin family